MREVQDMKKELKLVFETKKGSLVTYSIPDPKASLTKEQIKTAMQVVVDKDIFETANGALATPVSAKVVETSETAFDLTV